jgi:hypothetical protein
VGPEAEEEEEEEEERREAMRSRRRPTRRPRALARSIRCCVSSDSTTMSFCAVEILARSRFFLDEICFCFHV